MNELKDRAAKCIDALKKLYPNTGCSLCETEPWRLLIAVRLSAQCTDKCVNSVTPALFERFETIERMADASEEDIAAIIRPCGLFRTKARDIKAMCTALVTDFGGAVPDDIDTLCTLPGVGRKTANLIVGDVYGKFAVVVDTHFIRISNRLGLTQSKNPETIEKEMRLLLPASEANAFCHRTVDFGRDICRAVNPRCDACPLQELCIKTQSTKCCVFK